MKAGNFNIRGYIERLNEEASNTGRVDPIGMVLPDETKKSYDWLKSEFQKARTEVKVEINMGGSKFEPGYDLQSPAKSVDNFKPGMYGQVKTDGKTENEDKDKKEGAESKENSVEKQNNNSKKKPAESKAKIEGSTVKFDIKTKK